MALVTTDFEKYLKLVPIVQTMGHKHMGISYDSEADVLYISFHVPAKPAADSELTENDVIIRYDERDEIIGLTILNASKR